MLNIDNLAEKVFGILKGFGHQLKLYTVDGVETVDPIEARRFFSNDMGLMVTIDDINNELQMSRSDAQSLGDTKRLQKNLKNLANEFLMNYTMRVYGKSIKPRDFSYKAKQHRNSDMKENTEINELSPDLKRRYHDAGMDRVHDGRGKEYRTARDEYSSAKSAQKRARSFAIFNRDEKLKKSQRAVDDAREKKLQVDHTDKKRAHWLNKTRRQLDKEHSGEIGNVAEGISRLSGTKKTSHQRLENVQILVKHKRAVDEEVRGSRSRNIHSVFLEQNGERLRFPHNHLGGARAMARHMTQGGTMQDKTGTYIIESVGSLLQLSEFLRYAKSNKLINEDTFDIIETVRENINIVKTELYRLAGVKTYESIKARIEEQVELVLQETDIDSLRDMFTVKKFDEKFDNVLPVVNKLVQEKDQFLRRIEESSGNTVYITASTFALDSILEFACKEAQMGYKLCNVSSRIIENLELASYVNIVGNKLSKGNEITAFESTVIRNVLENLTPYEYEGNAHELVQESVRYEQFFDRYSYLFI